MSVDELLALNETGEKAPIDGIQLTINLSLLKLLSQAGVTIGELVVLICLYTERLDLLEAVLPEPSNEEKKKVFMQSVIRKQLAFKAGAVEDPFRFLDYQLTEAGKALCERTAYRSEEKVSEGKEALDDFGVFIQSFLELFPGEVKNNGGKILRSNPVDTRLKMIRFMNRYKRYGNKELILNSTRVFIDKYRGDFSFCPTAEYFISKNGTSYLATECEAYLMGASSEGKGGNPFEKTM